MKCSRRNFFISIAIFLFLVFVFLFLNISLRPSSKIKKNELVNISNESLNTKKKPETPPSSFSKCEEFLESVVLTASEKSILKENLCKNPEKASKTLKNFFFDAKKENFQRMEKRKFGFGLFSSSNAHSCANKVLIDQLLETSTMTTEFDFIIYLSDMNLKSIYDNFEILLHQKYSKWKGDLVFIDSSNTKKSYFGYYRDSSIKLLPFNHIEYDKIILLDSDILVLKDLSHLFFLPPDVPLAAPLAYWKRSSIYFTTLLMVISPNPKIFKKLEDLFDGGVPGKDTDMDVINLYFSPISENFVDSEWKNFTTFKDFILLPLEYSVLTHSIRTSPRNINQHWIGEPEDVFNRAFLIHYSEGGKPWSPFEEITTKNTYVGNVWKIWEEKMKKICEVEGFL